MKEFLLQFGSVLGALWRRGNSWLRLACGILIAWPFAIAILAALVSPPAAMTVIPIFTLAILLVLLAYLLNISLALAIVASIEGGRRIVLGLISLIGAELVIGVYFSVVPVANDRGLVPLLVLSACAL